MSKNRMTIVGVSFLSTITLIYTIYFIEYLFGNGDGLWGGIIVKSFGLKILLIEATVFLIYLGFKSKVKWIQNALYIILSSIITLVAFDFLIGILIKTQENAAKKTQIASKESVYKVQYKGAIQQSDTLGFKATPNWSFQWPRMENGKSLIFSSDTFSRRITPFDSTPNNIEYQYALFFGCSFTYGDGVSDEETMPAYFQNLAPNYQAYNYGFLAYSPLHTLARLQYENIASQVLQKNGFGVFTYIQDHIDRTIPATRWVLFQQGNFPNLVRSSMKIDGLYHKKHRVWVDVLRWLSSTNTSIFFKLGYPKHHTEAHYQLIVDVIYQAKKEYQKQFKNNRFYVIIFPNQDITPAMKLMMTKAGLELFDYSKLFELNDYTLRSDKIHPDERAYYKIMQQFYIDLKKRGYL